MPALSEIADVRQAIESFVLDPPAYVLDPSAERLARASLGASGLLPLGEAHGVAENPVVIRWLIALFLVGDRIAKPLVGLRSCGSGMAGLRQGTWRL